VGGRGIASPHGHVEKSEEEKESRRPVIAMDYFYMNSKDNPSATLLAMKDEKSATVFASVVPSKGVSEEWVAERAARFVNKLGYKEVTLKSDTEPAMVALRGEIREKCQAEALEEDAGVGDHQSNGLIENAIRNIRGVIRTLKLSVESNIKEKIADDSVVMAWIVEHSANLITTCSKGQDGRTAYERVHGKKPPQVMIPVGEKVMFQNLHQGRRQNKLEPKFEYGIWVGLRSGSPEVYVATESGVSRSRSIRRLPKEDCWDAELIKNITGTPWDLKSGVMEDHVPGERGPEEQPPPMPPPQEEEEEPVRRMKLTKKDFDKYGHTPKCQGCRAAQLGKTAQGHTDDCRNRMEGLIGQTPEGTERLLKRAIAMDEAQERKMLRSERVALKRKEPEAAEDRAPEPREASGTSSAASGSGLERGEKRKGDEIDDSGRTKVVDQQLQHERGTTKVVDQQLQHERRATKVVDQQLQHERGATKVVDQQLQQERGTKRAAEGPPDPGGTPPLDTGAVEDGAVVEVYSPPRIAEEARKRGGAIGASLDIRTGWNFNLVNHRNEAFRLIVEMRPSLLVASPMCTAFSPLQTLNQKRDANIRSQELEYGRNHVRFAIKMMAKQLEMGGYILFEHPRAATTWALPEMKEFVAKYRLCEVTADQCMYGLVSSDALGEGPAMKPTRFITNSPKIAQSLSTRCDRGHRHVQLLGGRAKEAEQYPPGLCTAICRGLEAQLQKDKADKECNVELNYLEQYFDSITGEQLDPEAVRRGRREEIQYYRQMKVYYRMNREEAAQKFNVKPLKLRWVDVNKARAGETPNIRCRLVAKEIKKDERPELFAGTPPLEALKILCRIASSRRKEYEMMHIDVSRAYFHAAVTRPVIIEIPPEDWQEGDDGKVGVLLKSMYGTRDAASNWASEFTKTLQKVGFEVGESSSNVFRHRRLSVVMVVHGDDFIAVGPRRELDEIEAEMKKKYPVKTQRIGEAPDREKSMRVLGRDVKWTSGGIKYAADRTHVETIIKELGVQEAKGVSSPAVEERKKEDEEEEALRDGEATAYRALAARCNYLSADRADITFAVKEICKKMASPSRSDWDKVKRLGRYLKMYPKVEILFPFGQIDSNLQVFSDSDWAGDRDTRRSTSAGSVMWGGATLKAWTRQQKTLARSSAEAELYAANLAVSEAMGIQSLLKDMGVNVNIVLNIDAKATQGILHRQGLGKMKHIEVQHLWLQSVVKNGKVIVQKIDTKYNPADIGTKALDGERIKLLMHILNMVYK